MKRVSSVLLLACCLAMVPTRTGDAAEVRFATSVNANFFWIIDQISQWEPEYTDPAFRAYWMSKLKFNPEDAKVLHAYVTMRRRLADLESPEYKRVPTPAESLFGRAGVLPHERFLVAFVNTENVDQAAALLRLAPEDAATLKRTLIHFARKIQPHWKEEVGHLKQFTETANGLAVVAMPGDYVDQVRRFFGLQGNQGASVRVNVLWAPNGTMLPTHVGPDILLPVAKEHVASDLSVLRQMGMALRQVSAFLLSSMPEDVLLRAGRRLLAECGYLNPDNSDVVKDALLAALGEMFLRERFPDLANNTLIIPYDNRLEYPYAADELARRFIQILPGILDNGRPFFPDFVDRAIEEHKKLFPPVPRYFAYTGLLLADSDVQYLFGGLFRSVDRVEFGLDDVQGFLARHAKEPGRTAFVVVRAKDEGKMWDVLKGMNAWRDLSKEIRKLKGKDFIYPLYLQGRGPIFVIRCDTVDGLRRGLLELFTLKSMPQGPLVLR